MPLRAHGSARLLRGFECVGIPLPRSLRSAFAVRRGFRFVEVTLEKLDDVAFEIKGNPAELLQFQHHIDKTASLTDGSSDIWKTIRVWSEGITQRRPSSLGANYLQRFELHEMVEFDAAFSPPQPCCLSSVTNRECPRPLDGNPSALLSAGS